MKEEVLRTEGEHKQNAPLRVSGTGVLLLRNGDVRSRVSLESITSP